MRRRSARAEHDLKWPTIQQAINAASNGDEIIVAQGVYNEAINFNGKYVHLRSADGPEVTTIDADGLETSVVTGTSGEGPDTILEGFTITGGIGTDVGDGFRRGGGMYNVGASPTLIGCVFEGHSAGDDGGGLWGSSDSAAQVEATQFCENTPNHIAGQWDDFGGNMFQAAADLNCDGVVDGADLLILLSAWGECADPNDCAADLNSDKVVDVLDLIELINNWG